MESIEDFLSKESIGNSSENANSSQISLDLAYLTSIRGENDVWARVIAKAPRIVVPGLGTAGVGIHKRTYHLFYDRDWYESLETRERFHTLIHEASHIVFHHIPRYVFLKNTLPKIKWDRMHMLINYAMDVAANEIALAHRPKFNEYENNEDGARNFLTSQDVEKILREHGLNEYVRRKESFEHYLGLLLKCVKKKKGGGEGKGDPDGGQKVLDKHPDKKGGGQDKHDRWEPDGAVGEEAKLIAEQLKNDGHKLTKSAVEETEKCRGTVPGNLKSELQKYADEANVPWHMILRDKLQNAVASHLEESMALPHIGLAGQDEVLPYPGNTWDYTMNIAFFIDTSGSVGQRDFRVCMGEMKSLVEVYGQNVSIWCIMADHGIQAEFKLGLDSEMEVSQVARYGHGGTEFNAPFKRILGCDTDSDWATKEHRLEETPPAFDLVVYFTDGYAPVASPHGPVPMYLPDCPVLWVICRGGHADPLMENVIECA